MFSLFDESVALAEGNSPTRIIRLFLGHHGDTVDDGTHTQAQGTPSAIRRDRWEMGIGVKGYCLIAGIVTDHVAFPTVDAHVFVDNGNHLLSVVQVVVGSDTRESESHLVL